jgi:hypothetical protein
MSIRNPILQMTAAAGLLVLVSAAGAFAQQSKSQQKCLNALNKDGTLVAKQQGKEGLGCLKNAGTGKLVGTAQSCLTADAKGKVQKKKDKTTADETKSCGTAPDFGYTSAATVNAAAVQAELDLTEDAFGADLDAAVIACSTSKPGCGCQQKVSKDVEKLAATKLKEFLKCKKAVLAAGATSAASLRACVDDAGTPGSLAADTKGKLQKGSDKITADIMKKCDTPGVTTGAFPGDCDGLAGATLGDCLDVLVECRVCQMINEMDGLFVNCDLFDDGSANASCASGTGPSPTPTPTLTPTPTPTKTFAPGVVLQGVLPPTTGRFNYNLVLGIPGSDAACNTNFPGSHTCTFAELQSAQAAGDLAGARDTNGMTVTSFWAIDLAHANNVQCNDSLGTVVDWEYQTAHTGIGGEASVLNNGAGTLGSVTGGLICGAMKWVGCCL